LHITKLFYKFNASESILRGFNKKDNKLYVWNNG
jgi:hypothetical protein